MQLVNKFDNLPFSKNDENFLEAFAIFCGMGLHNTHMSVLVGEVGETCGRVGEVPVGEIHLGKCIRDENGKETCGR